MPENPPDKKDLMMEKDKIDEKSSSSEVKNPRSYYYDDACGYEVYSDEDADDDEDEPFSEEPKT